jgi:energy-coupling factor transport system permease protein
MIELSRTITFGQYINNSSRLTRMDPRSKLFCVVLLIILVSYIASFSAFALCLLFCVIVQLASRISTPYVLRSFRPFLGFLVFIFFIEVLFYQAPPGTRQIWQWGPVAVSWRGISSSTLTIIRVLFLYYLTSMLLFTTSLVDLTDGSEALLSPLQKLGVPVSAFVTILVIAFRFVPIFVTELERLIKAQSARGVRFDKGNFIQRTRAIGSLLVPLFVSGFKRAEALSIAMEARCYGSRPGWRRSKRRALRFDRFDATVLTLTVMTCLVAVVINLTAPF